MFPLAKIDMPFLAVAHRPVIDPVAFIGFDQAGAVDGVVVQCALGLVGGDDFNRLRPVHTVFTHGVEKLLM